MKGVNFEKQPITSARWLRRGGANGPVARDRKFISRYLHSDVHKFVIHSALLVAVLHGIDFNGISLTRWHSGLWQTLIYRMAASSVLFVHRYRNIRGLETRFRTESFSAFTVPVLDGTIVSKISVCVLHGNTIFNITFNFAFAHSELCKLNLIRGNFVCSFRSLLIVIFDGRKVF